MLEPKTFCLFSVLASLLVEFVAAFSAPTLPIEATWPYDLPPHVKHFPGDEKMVQKKLEVRDRLILQRPHGLRKMNPKEDEMFFPAYWQFDPDEHVEWASESQENEISIPISPFQGEAGEITRGWANLTVLDRLEAPLKLHRREHDSQVWPQPVLDWLPRLPRDLLSPLARREFQCPGDTVSCTEIDRPNSCCPEGGVCQLVSDTGLGDVGCCSEGQTCSQELADCLNGYTSCPASSGGGCCIPGYECVDVGCKSFRLR